MFQNDREQTEMFQDKKNGADSIQGEELTEEQLNKNDDILLQKVAEVLRERKKSGLEGLVFGLDSIIINTEPENQEKAIQQLLETTGFGLKRSYEDDLYITAVLTLDGSADILLRSRKKPSENPFKTFNTAPKSKHLPNTRLESYVFRTNNLPRYVEIQKSRGIKFLTEDIIKNDHYLFIGTTPSVYTGTSTGIIQWLDDSREYVNRSDRKVRFGVKKPDWRFLENIKWLDHAAIRVRSKDRDPAITELMELTNYKFDFAIYVKLFNSITSVARFTEQDFAMVFTSGISSYKNDRESGPTEKYVHNYNPRTHHMAFHTENIDDTFSHLKYNGMEFLVELVGSPQEGLKQTFTEGSEHTLIVSEYIHRYGDFDGFFTKSNVTLLTESTDKQ